MSKKNKILFISLGVSLISLAIDSFNVERVFCEGYRCSTFTDSNLFGIFSLSTLSFFFVLVSKFLREQVFVYWWKFAQFAIPAVLLVSFVVSLELHHSPGGWFNIDNEVDFTIMSFTYLVFILGSAIQMYRGFRVKGE